MVQNYVMNDMEKLFASGYDARKRGWYKVAVENPGKLIFSEPYVDAFTGKMVITISKTTK